MTSMEAKFLAKLTAIEQVMFEMFDDNQRQEFATRLAWRMIEWEGDDILCGTIWENME